MELQSAELADLTEEIKQAKITLRRLRKDIGVYEEGMRYTREEDAKRTERLEKWEANLKARERRIVQDSADLEHRQRQFRQLKDITP